MKLPTADYLKYANLQMAAEAFIRDPDTGVLHSSGTDLIEALVTGNRHSSVFTRTQAEAFADPGNGWTVLDQRANTSTGFSGTLFKHVKTGELVISFRSTEFIDDAARDNLATNTNEIKKTGYAWGQISDMEQWYAELKADPGKLGEGKAFSVTGYSLGGHLATTFNLLHPDAAQQVVTFNGAGVGKVTQGTLAAALATFDTLRQDHLQVEARFSDQGLAAVYRTIRSHLADQSWTVAQAKSALNDAYAGGMTADALVVWSALGEIAELKAEAARVALLKAGGTGAGANSSPDFVADSLIGAENLDYRMAVHYAGKNTKSAWITDDVTQAYGSKAYLDTLLGNQYDVVGDTSPSAVANSLWHTGADVRFFIEDQPLYRGGIGGGVLGAALDYGSIKLLVDGYALKDFGDTHSLVLLIDSLNLQNTLLQLVAPAGRDAAGATINAVLREASYLKRVDGDLLLGSGQGKAEGDVLENVVNSLADIFLGTGAVARLAGNSNGNSWARTQDQDGYSGRIEFYERLKEVTGSSAYRALEGKLSLSSGAGFCAADARADFGAFMSAYCLSPFILKLGAETAIPPAWGEMHATWLADNAALAANSQSPLLTISDRYLADRTEFLLRKQWFNRENVKPENAGAPSENDPHAGHPYLTDATYFEDAESGYVIAQGYPAGTPYANIQRHYFGDSAANTFNGGAVADRLYGMDGADILTGLGGDDHIEGGAGDDKLQGGSGSDTLAGGAGTDVYVLSSGDGHDAIVDVDGLGSIELDGKTLNGEGVQVSEKVWRSVDSLLSVRYELVTDEHAVQTLKVSIGTSGQQVDIRGWQAGDLGITLLQGAVDGWLAKFDAAVRSSAQWPVMQEAIRKSGYLLKLLATFDGDFAFGRSDADTIRIDPASLPASAAAAGAWATTLAFDLGRQLSLSAGIRPGAANTVQDAVKAGLQHEAMGAYAAYRTAKDLGSTVFHGDANGALYAKFESVSAALNPVSLADPGYLAAMAQAGSEIISPRATLGNSALTYAQLFTANWVVWHGNNFTVSEKEALYDSINWHQLSAGSATLQTGVENASVLTGAAIPTVTGGTLSFTAALSGDNTPQVLQLVLSSTNDSGNLVATTARVDSAAGVDYVEVMTRDAKTGSVLTVDVRGQGDVIAVDGATVNVARDSDVTLTGSGLTIVVGDNSTVNAKNAFIDLSEVRNGATIVATDATLIGKIDADAVLAGHQVLSLNGWENAIELRPGTVFRGAMQDGAIVLHAQAPDFSAIDLYKTVDGRYGIVKSEANGDFNSLWYAANGDLTQRAWQENGVAHYERYNGGATMYSMADFPASAVVPAALDIAFNIDTTGNLTSLVTNMAGAGNIVLSIAQSQGVGTAMGGSSYYTKQGYNEPRAEYRNSYSGSAGKDANTLYYDSWSWSTEQIGNAIYDSYSSFSYSTPAYRAQPGYSSTAILSLSAKDYATHQSVSIVFRDNQAPFYSAVAYNPRPTLVFSPGDENAPIVGTEYDDILAGNAGNNVLDGLQGADKMSGYGGDDTYLVDNAYDVINEGVGAGIDLVQASATYTLGANVDNMTLMGSASISGTGNILGNVLTGNAGNNGLYGMAGGDKLYGGLGNDVLDGGAGVDIMAGGLGDDTYYVDNAGDQAVENANEGTDTIWSAISMTLSAHFENLTLTGSGAISGSGHGGDNILTGNAASNTLTGYAGNDTLDGRAGADSMAGGTGNDTYMVDAASDVVTENANEGTDTVQSTVSYTLADNIENLTLTGYSAINGTGNSVANIVTGNSYANTLDGKGGADTLIGGQGNDIYVASDAGDQVVESANQGTDTVMSALSYTLPANVENLTLTDMASGGTGNALVNVIQGNIQHNVIDGGTGNDTLKGGLGSDTYLMARGGGIDTIIETDATAGNRDVASFGAGISFDQLWFRHLGNNLEITIIGTGDKFNVQNWYLDSASRVEEIRTTDGRVLQEGKVEALVQAMANMAMPSMGQLTLTGVQHQQLDGILATSWA